MSAPDEPNRESPFAEGLELASSMIALMPLRIMDSLAKTHHPTVFFRLNRYPATKERACLRSVDGVNWLYKESAMLGYALMFLIIAIIAGVFGFGGVAAASAGIAQLIFYVFLVLLIVSLLVHFMRGRSI